MPIKCGCINCGAAFTVPPSRVENKACRFCSPTCYQAYLRKTYWVETRCEHCGKTFETRRCELEAGKRRHCSLECRRRAGRKDLPTKVLTCKCKRCGKPFRLKPIEVLSGKPRRYCSRACRDPLVEKVCLTCGEAFTGINKRYCSKACYQRSNAATLPEMVVKAALQDLRLGFEEEVQAGPGAVDFLVLGRVALEVDGEYWHRHRKESQRKQDAIMKAGWIQARVAEAELADHPKDAVSRALILALVGIREAKIVRKVE